MIPRLNLRQIILPLALAASLLVVITGCQAGDSQPEGVGTTATAKMQGPDGADLGTVTLTQGPQGVLVMADLTGLAPGAHGFHIHEVGTCSPDFSAAGDHFTLEGVEHGYMNPNGQHLGDMPNIHAAADGTARADVFNGAVTLADGSDNSVFDADGSAIIVHEKGDTYGADAGAGGRVACGVIEKN